MARGPLNSCDLERKCSAELRQFISTCPAQIQNEPRKYLTAAGAVSIELVQRTALVLLSNLKISNQKKIRKAIDEAFPDSFWIAELKKQQYPYRDTVSLYDRFLRIRETM